MVRILQTALAALAFLWLVACGHHEDEPPPTEASAVIGAAGGTLDGPDGTRVVIPAGALDADTRITIARRSTGAPDVLPDGFDGAGDVYEFTPHDIAFRKAVTVRVPFRDNPQAQVRDVLRASPGLPWVLLGVTPAGGFAEWETATFSWYAPVACFYSVPSPDPYPCRGLSGTLAFTAQPAQAVTVVQPLPGVEQLQASAAVTLTFTTTLTAPPDCADARMSLKRVRSADGTSTVLNTAPAAEIRRGATFVQFRASLTAALDAADNGRTVFVAYGSCRRAYQRPERANLTPEQQRISGFNQLALDVQIAPAPQFTQQPADQSVTEGHGAAFAATAQGAQSLQWQRSTDGGLSWTDIAGATGGSLSITATTLADNGNRYRLAATNSGGSAFSRGATLTVTPAAATAPQVTQQPVDQAVPAGSSATFSAAISGTPLPALQWQRSADGGATWQDIAGATADSLTLAAVAVGDNASQFRLVGRNASGSIATAAARLSVVERLSGTPEGKLALGRAHACAVKADYTVACWGFNNQGQLGTGGTADAPAPVGVAGLDRVIAVAVGSRGSSYLLKWGQSCAVQAEGGLWCWGQDVNGVDQPTPQAVAGVANAVAVAVGSGHACYLGRDTRVRCWGFNIAGELGNGEVGNPQATPGLVTANGVPLSGVKAIGAGDQWTCALFMGGTVSCWGQGFNGNADPTPQPVGNLSGATALSVGSRHACALVAGGAVRCWGFGGNGQLGDGGLATSTSAVAVTGLTGVSSIAAGVSDNRGPGHTCAQRSSGDVVCWGAANLGNGSSSATVPGAPVTGLADIDAVAAGSGSTCALRTDGQVLCWGGNFYGQLGVGDTVDRAAPTPTAAGAVFWRP